MWIETYRMRRGLTRAQLARRASRGIRYGKISQILIGMLESGATKYTVPTIAYAIGHVLGAPESEILTIIHPAHRNGEPYTTEASDEYKFRHPGASV